MSHRAIKNNLVSFRYIRNRLFTGLCFVQTCSNLSVFDGETASFGKRLSIQKMRRIYRTQLLSHLVSLASSLLTYIHTLNYKCRRMDGRTDGQTQRHRSIDTLTTLCQMRKEDFFLRLYSLSIYSIPVLQIRTRIYGDVYLDLHSLATFTRRRLAPLDVIGVILIIIIIILIIPIYVIQMHDRK